MYAMQMWLFAASSIERKWKSQSFGSAQFISGRNNWTHGIVEELSNVHLSISDSLNMRPKRRMWGVTLKSYREPSACTARIDASNESAEISTTIIAVSRLIDVSIWLFGFSHTSAYTSLPYDRDWHIKWNLINVIVPIEKYMIIASNDVDAWSEWKTE